MVLHNKHLLCFAKVAKATPAISDLKGKLAALELEQVQDEAAEQVHTEASALAAKIAALEEQKMKKAAAKKSADDFAAAAATETAQKKKAADVAAAAALVAAAEVGCHFPPQQSHCV